MTREQAMLALKEKINYYESDKRLKVAIETIIPELAENDDERIRKFLIDMVKRETGFAGFPSQGQVLAYLEKQKDLDKMIVVSPEVWDNAISDAYENGKKDGEKQKEQKPVPISCGQENVSPAEVCYGSKGDPDPAGVWKPSENEERLINTSIFFLKDFADKGYENAVECIDWLKSKLNGNSCK